MKYTHLLLLILTFSIMGGNANYTPDALGDDQTVLDVVRGWWNYNTGNETNDRYETMRGQNISVSSVDIPRPDLNQTERIDWFNTASNGFFVGYKTSLSFGRTNTSNTFQLEDINFSRLNTTMELTMLEFGSGYVESTNATITKNYTNNYIVQFNPQLENYTVDEVTIPAFYFNMTIDWNTRVGWSNISQTEFQRTTQYFGDDTVNQTINYWNGTTISEIIDYGSSSFVFEGYYAPSIFRIIEFTLDASGGLLLDQSNSVFPNKYLLDWYIPEIQEESTSPDTTSTTTPTSTTSQSSATSSERTSFELTDTAGNVGTTPTSESNLSFNIVFLMAVTLAFIPMAKSRSKRS